MQNSSSVKRNVPLAANDAYFAARFTSPRPLASRSSASRFFKGNPGMFARADRWDASSMPYLIPSVMKRLFLLCPHPCCLPRRVIGSLTLPFYVFKCTADKISVDFFWIGLISIVRSDVYANSWFLGLRRVMGIDSNTGIFWRLYQFRVVSVKTLILVSILIFIRPNFIDRIYHAKYVKKVERRNLNN